MKVITRKIGDRLGWRCQEALDLCDAESTTMRELADALGVSYQAAQQTVMRLERHGLVEREWAIGRYRRSSPIRVVV